MPGDAGPPYLVAARLITLADEYWDTFDGYCALRGVDPFALPIGRLLNAVWAWLIDGWDAERVEEVRTLLWEDVTAEETGLPVGAPSWWSEEPQDAAFSDAMSKDARMR